MPTSDFTIFNSTLPTTAVTEKIDNGDRGKSNGYNQPGTFPSPGGPVFGLPSYWNVTITQGGLLNGTYDDWCVRTDQGINNGTYTANVYSSYGTIPSGILPNNTDANTDNYADSLQEINWLFNNVTEQANVVPEPLGNPTYPGVYLYNGVEYTLGDIQLAIWKLLGNTIIQHDLDTLRVFDTTQTKADNLVSLAQTNGSSFISGIGQDIGVILQPTDGSQIQIIEVKTAGVGDTIFFDLNGNGIADSGEGLAGVKVKLDANNDGTIDGTTTTDSNGLYLFGPLLPGTYKVMVDTSTLPAGYTNTFDPDGVKDSMSVVNLAPGEINLTQDFGYQAYDFGDAPDPKYPTLLANDGARHLLSNGQTSGTPVLKLGTLVDTELNGLPNSTATGDNLNNLNDEDGVTFTSILTPGSSATVSVSVMGNGGFLNAWIDFNADGDWNDAGEQIFTNQAVTNGFNNLTFAVPVGASFGDTFTRFRLSTQSGLAPTGAAPDGEVEDYQVNIAPPNQPVGTIGDTIFFDRNSNGSPDPGEGLADVIVYLDKNNDGIFDALTSTDSNGQYLFTNLPGGTYKVIVDTNSLPFSGVGFNNTADPDGVKDSMSVVVLPTGGNNLDQDFGYQAYDFGDAPDPKYPTLLANNGARHLLSIGQTTATPVLKLGNLIDTELDGQPDANATGDNLSNLNDEDGVTFTSLVAGQNSTVTVSVMGNGGFLNAWLDFNADGDWNDAGEQVFTNLAVSNGVNNLSFLVPVGATVGDTFSRFRLSTDQNLGTTGAAIDGEVEDYKVIITPQLLGTIGDTIFFDRNGNGTPDVGEGLSGVKVNLDINNDGTIDKMATTDANGLYTFTNLPGGTYKVIVDTNTLPLGGVGFSNTVDPDGGNNSMSVVVLPSGDSNLNQDFGYQAYDFGDAPDSYGTLLASNGARHLLSIGQTPATPLLKLGNLIDTEFNGQPNATATGDNISNLDDEDGITFSPLVAGQNSTVTVTVMGNGGFLNAWLDFNADGDWNDAGEQIFTNQAVVNGVNNLSLAVPGTATSGMTFSRFRLSSEQNLGTTGAAIDGEVEDYKVTISQLGDLKITKTDGVTVVAPGDKVTYTIVVSNSGPSTATNALVSDPFPSILTGVTWSSVAAGGATNNDNPFPSVGTGNINDTVTLPSGSSITYTVMGTVAANVNSLSDFTSLGSNNTLLAQNVTVNSVTADAFYGNYLSSGTSLYLRNEPNDNGIGVLSPGEVASAGGDQNELSNQLNQEIIRLTKANTDKWTSLWVSSLDSGGSGGAEMGTLYWSNSATPTLSSLPNTQQFTFKYGDFGSSVEGNLLTLSQSSGFDTAANYVFFVAGPAGTNNDYLVWKTTTATAQLKNTATVKAPDGFTDTNPNNNSDTDCDTIIVPQPLGSIGDTIFFDRNGNGTPDAGEGLSGVKVNLDINKDGSIDQTTTTNSNGQYLFSNLPGGIYKVIVDTNTLPLGGVGFSNTIDPDGGNNSMSVVVLPSGVSNLNQDFGYQAYDFGDAPNSYGTTLPNGARHLLSIGQTPATPLLKLGKLIDTEFNGQPNANATGDNLNNLNDEDGVTFGTLQAGQTANVTVTVMGDNGLLNAWVDFNGDGDWNDKGEQIFTNQAVSNGVNNLTFAVPVGTSVGATFSRFRLSTQKDLASNGAAPDGEVEDYKVTISPPDDLSITKTDKVTKVVPGQMVTYTIVVSNNGGSTATNALVSDVIPTILTGVKWSSVAAGGATNNDNPFPSFGTGNIKDYVTLPGGSSITYTVKGTVAANVNSLSDFTSLGSNNTLLAQNVTVNGVKADAFYGNYLSSGTSLYLRNEPNDNGIGVLSPGEVASAGGDQNELSNQKNQEIIRLTKADTDTWTSLWVSSLDSGGSGGAEKGTLYWSNLATPNLNTLTTKFTFQYGDFGKNKVEGDILSLSKSSSFDPTAKYVFFIAGPNKEGTNNDYLVWKATTATTQLTNTATVTAPAGFIDTNLKNNTDTDTDTLICNPKGYGCNQDYWQKNTSDWVGYDTKDKCEKVFGIDFNNNGKMDGPTLKEALDAKGDDKKDKGDKYDKAFLCDSVVALLNASSFGSKYCYTPKEVMELTKMAFEGNCNPFSCNNPF